MADERAGEREPRTVDADPTAAFFARVTASISHELKNVLATISESSGLLGDLLQATRDVGALDREELLDCGGTIEDEIRRGFGIVRNLNRFAHSADHPFAEVDLAETVGLAADIAGYLRRSCPVAIDAPAGGLRIRTRPHRLIELAHRALAAAFEVVGSEGSLRVVLEAKGAGAGFRLAGVEGERVRRAGGAGLDRVVADLAGHLETAGDLAVRLPADAEAAG